MPERITRRLYLLAAIRACGGPVSTSGAVQLLAESPWPTSGRNTARKDLRALSSRGYLTPVKADGRRSYLPTPTSLEAHA